MFSLFSQRKKKEQIDRLFSEHVSPEIHNAAAASEFSKLNELSEGPVEFVFAVVQGATANETGQQLGVVATIAHQKRLDGLRSSVQSGGSCSWHATSQGATRSGAFRSRRQAASSHGIKHKNCP